MSRSTIMWRFTAALVLILCSSVASATNGYFGHGITVSERAMGGAGAANPTSPLSVDANPAALVDVGSSTDIVLSLFSPDRHYRATGNPSSPEGNNCGANCPFSIGSGDQSLTSNGSLFAIPSVAFSRKINDRNAWGLAFIARGGMNTEWDGGSAYLAPMGTTMELPGTFGAGKTSSNLSQLYVKASYSHQFNEMLTMGAALFYNYQMFEVEGVGNFAGFSSNPQKLSNQGEDTSSGVGVKVGALIKPSQSLSFGLAYQPKVNMSEFENYSGLFTNNGDFDYPENYVFGMAYQLKLKQKFIFDIQQINYSGVAALGNGISPLTDGSCMPGMTGGAGDGCLGGKHGAGFGWKDVTVYKFGYEVGVGNHYLRLGYSQTEQPVPESEVLFNILAPAVIEQHFTFGWDMRDENARGFQFSLMYAPEKSVVGVNTFDPGQIIELRMSQWEVSIGYQF